MFYFKVRLVLLLIELKSQKFARTRSSNTSISFFIHSLMLLTRSKNKKPVSRCQIRYPAYGLESFREVFHIVKSLYDVELGAIVQLANDDIRIQINRMIYCS